MVVPRSGFAPARRAVVLGAFVAANIFSVSALALHLSFGGRVGFHPLGVLSSNLAREFSHLGQYGISENLGRLALADYSSKTKHDSGYAAALYYTGLGMVARHDQASAEPYLKHSLEILYNLNPGCAGHRAPMRPLDKVAEYYVREYQPQLALQLFETQLARLEDQKRDLQDADVTVDYSYLAKVYKVAAVWNYQLGYYNRAEEFCKRSNILYKMSGAPENNHVYENDIYIALSLVKQFRYAEAEPYALACKRYQQTTGNVCARDIQVNNVVLAYIYEMSGRSELSQATYSSEMIATISKTGDGGDGTLQAWTSDLLASRHQYVEARAMLMPVIEQLSADFEKDNPTLLKMEERLAKLDLYQGNIKAARKATVEIIALREKKLGYWSCDTARSYCLLGTIDRRLGDRDKALTAWKIAGHIWTINHGTTTNDSSPTVRQ